MAVRVRLKLTHNDREAETVALVNTGFETDEPEILLPLKLAEKLGLHPPPEGSSLEEYDVIGGTAFILRCPKAIQVQVLVEDRETLPVEAIPLVSDREEEVLISDVLASRLGIAIDDAGRGIWRFADEPLMKRRKSERPMLWR